MPMFPRAPGSTRPRSRILSGVGLVLALLASLIAFASSPVDATGGQGSDDECYVEVQETKYKREIPEHTYEKHTSTRYWDPQDWEWGDWSEWTLWGGGSTQTVVGFDPPEYVDTSGDPISEDGVPHGSGFGWERNYRYQMKPDSTTGSGTYEKTGWLTEEPDGDGWQVWKTRTVKGETFPCPSAEATSGTCEAPGEITPTESEHYTSEIEDGVVTFTATPPAVFGDDVQTEFDFSDEIAQLEGEQCDEEVTPEDPEVTLSKECEVPDKLHVPETEGVTYFLGDDDVTGETLEGSQSGTLTAEADEGYKLNDPDWEFTFDLAAAEPCPEEVAPGEPGVNQSEECEVEGTLVIPDTGGVVYLLDTGEGDEVIEPGTHEGPISGTLSVEAEEGHVLVGDDDFPMEIDIAAAEDCPPPPPPPEDPDDPVTSASVDYVCDADGSVTFSSTDGASDFVVEVDGEIVHSETLEGTNEVDITIDGTTSVIVRADDVVLVNENVEFEACDDDGEVGGIGAQAPEPETEEPQEEPPASAPTSLPRTGISAGVLAMVAALTMGFGATLRAASRRLR
ncbi:MAG: hypothetical protein ACLFRV_10340 [Acidimicrobiales bacterium]